MSKNEKVTENKEQKEQTEQKVMTKYDRKVQKRKEEKEKEKKEERISTTVGIVFLVALVCLVASFPIRTYLATHETYVVINGEEVNKVEFERFLSEAKEGINLKKTNSMHFGTEGIRDIEPVVEKRMTTSIKDNGNNVDIDIEMTELAANEIYYSVLIQQLNSRLSNMNYVINR